jgi:hydrogenase maturation protease
MTSGAASRAAEVTIAGVGNWLLACDRVGPRVMELLQGRYGRGVELADIGSGGLALLDHMRGQQLLVVVDACVGRAAPGEVVVIEDVPDDSAVAGAGSHQLGAVEALVIARHLQPETLPRRVVLILAESADFDEDELDAVCSRVVQTLDPLVGDALCATGANVPEGRSQCL